MLHRTSVVLTDKGKAQLEALSDATGLAVSPMIECIVLALGSVDATHVRSLTERGKVLRATALNDERAAREPEKKLLREARARLLKMSADELAEILKR